MKIGITERGDAGLDYRWVNKLDSVDGAVLITKNVSDKFIEQVLPYKSKIIVHATCTGLGGTVIEPNVPWAIVQLEQTKKLIDKGFPGSQVVIRIDPIIPTELGIEKAYKVFCDAIRLGFKRFRVSILDMYPHVRRRFTEIGFESPYGNDFQTSDEQFNSVNAMLSYVKLLNSDIRIECCAENKLPSAIHTGCIGPYDANLLGLTVPEGLTCGHQRQGCMCLNGIKTEMLEHKHKCPHGCLYCYWRD